MFGKYRKTESASKFTSTGSLVVIPVLIRLSMMTFQHNFIPVGKNLQADNLAPLVWKNGQIGGRYKIVFDSPVTMDSLLMHKNPSWSASRYNNLLVTAKVSKST